MQHLHFPKIDSTQIYLKDHVDEFTDEQVLISCDEQTNGIGRTGNVWDFYPNSLALSFLLAPNPTLTLTSIEIGILTILFIEKKFNKNLKIKWPNDLMTPELKKCGGIMTNYINEKQIIAGAGINFTEPTNKYRYLADGILLPKIIDAKNLSLEFYNFILSERINSTAKIIQLFNENCAHINKKISFIIDPENSIQGNFKGINKNGEAIIELDGSQKTFLSGSLLLN